MRKTSLFLAFILTYVLLPQSATAQIWKNFEKKVGKKIEQQADRRLEKKVDKAIDKGFDKIEESTEIKPNEKPDEGKKQGGDNKDPGAVPGSSATNAAPVAGTYRFSMGVTYRMESSDKKEKMPSTSVWISDGAYIGMASDMQKSMFMVMDEGRMIAFMEDKKTYMTLGSGVASTIMNEAQKNTTDEKVEFEKVGTETIAGYPCDIYRMTTSDTEARIWVAPSIEVSGFMKSFAAITRNSRIPADAPASGLLLKMESKDKKGETFTMTATEIHRDPKIINTSEYKGMGGF